MENVQQGNHWQCRNHKCYSVVLWFCRTHTVRSGVSLVLVWWNSSWDNSVLIGSKWYDAMHRHDIASCWNFLRGSVWPMGSVIMEGKWWNLFFLFVDDWRLGLGTAQLANCFRWWSLTVVWSALVCSGLLSCVCDFKDGKNWNHRQTMTMTDGHGGIVLDGYGQIG